jgi:hypothetical protein
VGDNNGLGDVLDSEVHCVASAEAVTGRTEGGNTLRLQSSNDSVKGSTGVSLAVFGKPSGSVEC